MYEEHHGPLSGQIHCSGWVLYLLTFCHCDQTNVPINRYFRGSKLGQNLKKWLSPELIVMQNLDGSNLNKQLLQSRLAWDPFKFFCRTFCKFHIKARLPSNFEEQYLIHSIGHINTFLVKRMINESYFIAYKGASPKCKRTFIHLKRKFLPLKGKKIPF